MRSIRNYAALVPAILLITAFAVLSVNGQEKLISGSFILDERASDNSDALLAEIADRESASASERRDLAEKLKAPEDVSISVSGNSVTLDTSLGSPATFVADGVSRSSARADGSTVSLRARFTGEVLTISSLGGNADYTIVFRPIEGGKGLKVTRRITTAYLSETVFADSIYQRVSDLDSVADRDSSGDYTRDDDDGSYSDSSDSSIYGNASSGPDRSSAKARTVRTGNFVVPNGSTIVGTIENLVATDASQENDRFRIKVDSPSEFRGAVIEGYVSDIERTGKLAGKAKVTFNFERITLVDGRSYDFAGLLQEITSPEGDEIKINNEGEARGRSRTKETLKRGGIGAGIGAIIGGLLGGSKGAIIGATIGGGAGAGSMIPNDKEDLEILPGSVFKIQATGYTGK